MNPLQIGIIFFVSTLGKNVLGRHSGLQTCNHGFKAFDVEGTKLSKMFAEAILNCGCSPSGGGAASALEDSPMNRTGCLTKDGIPCQFPFTFKEKEYNSCTNEDLGGVYWCKTGPGEWDFGACNTTNPICMDSYPDGCPSKNPTAPCSFPFKYKGKMYNGCTTQDYGIRWCGTAHEVDIVHWAECSNACHDDDIQSEICILTHLGWIENGKVNGEAIERSIDSSLTDQPVIRGQMMHAFNRCFKNELYSHPSIGGYMEGIEDAHKLACLKLSVNTQ